MPKINLFLILIETFNRKKGFFIQELEISGTVTTLEIPTVGLILALKASKIRSFSQMLFRDRSERVLFRHQ